MSEVILGIVCLPAQTVFVVIYQKKKLRNCYTSGCFINWTSILTIFKFLGMIPDLVFRLFILYFEYLISSSNAP